VVGTKYGTGGRSVFGAHLLPQLSFIFLAALFPPLMAILSFAAAQLNEAWSYALGSAMFFGWMLAAAFPLVS